MAPVERLQKSERPSLLQGGGVFIEDGTVNFQNSSIHGNKADDVSAHAFQLRSMAPMD